MDWKEHIHSNKSILLGKPVIKGTRLSVEFIIELLASGWSEDKILENYPRLKKDDIIAIFSFIKESIQDNYMFELPENIS